MGIALVVRNSYYPEFIHTKAFGENYTFRIPATENLRFEFMAFGGWSEGQVNSSAEDFKDYVLKTAQEYNNPLIIESLTVETRPETDD